MLLICILLIYQLSFFIYNNSMKNFDKIAITGRFYFRFYWRWSRSTVVTTTSNKSKYTNSINTSYENNSWRRWKSWFTTGWVRFSSFKQNFDPLFISSKTAAAIQPVGNLPKLNKIVESGKHIPYLSFFFSYFLF